MRFVLLLLLCLTLAGCGEKATRLEDWHTSDLTLPGGQIIKVETMISNYDLLRGMAFRSSIEPDEGMLFIHKSPGNYPFWMYQHYIPLDMIFIGEDYRIVEIVENAQPCKSIASQCVHYGGTKVAKYRLELAAGMVKKYRLKLGDMLHW
jgi:uncharacterized membrane protein (UPF0127 family)